MRSNTVEAKQPRRGNRKKAVLPVQVKGKDSTGKEFEVIAHTLDVTPTGLRLGSVRHQLNALDEVTVFYRKRKMQFRVVWTKKLKDTSEYQVGLEAVMVDRDSWSLSFSEAPGAPILQAASGAA